MSYHEGVNHERLEQHFFWILVLAATVVFAWTVQSFFMPIFSGVVLSILFYPVYQTLHKKLYGYGSLASILVIALAVLLIALPLYGLGNLLVREAIGVYQSTAVDPAAFLSDSFARAPQLLAYANSFGISEIDIRARLAQAAQTSSTWVLSFAATATTQTLQFAIQLVITLYLMFFLLKDGESIADAVGRALPLSRERRDALFTRFVSTVRAVVKGSIVVSLVQGILGGVLFWIVGIPNPAVWGAVMAFLAILPFGGPTLVWLPAAVILFYSGNAIGAATVFAGGALGIGLIDNVLRPILVGRDIKMPDPLVLLSVLGGLATFGPGGVIIGPVIAALFLSVWEMFANERQRA